MALLLVHTNAGSLKWSTVQTESKEIGPTEAIAREYFDFLTQELDFNGCMLFASHGRIVFSSCQGWGNYPDSDSLDIETKFQLASVSKQFTAMIIMQLHEQGKLNYDDPVHKYLPGFPYPEITIRHLLTHSTGLPEYLYFFEKETPLPSCICNDDVVDYLTNNKPPLYFPPGQQFDYCNTNYCLLASIAEAASGKNFRDYLQDNIFRPVGMHNTFLFVRGDSLPAHSCATGYHYRWEKALTVYQDGVYGDKGIYSTAGDLYRWDQALYTEKLVKAGTLREAFSLHIRENERKFYGFGWRLFPLHDGSKIIFHSGWWRGFSTLIVRVPPNDYTLILLSNVVNFNSSGSFRRLFFQCDSNRFSVFRATMSDSLQ